MQSGGLSNHHNDHNDHHHYNHHHHKHNDHSICINSINGINGSRGFCSRGCTNAREEGEGDGDWKKYYICVFV